MRYLILFLNIFSVLQALKFDPLPRRAQLRQDFNNVHLAVQSRRVLSEDDLQREIFVARYLQNFFQGRKKLQLYVARKILQKEQQRRLRLIFLDR